ncbi:DUF2793 domain-containing protein [Candidatus Trichorickettsia mobilis]|uniref:DUF2793 domain-containing protein n=1 Tax=Candidatus Trichorickettsia mobilis TaxID=1346319 RepID=A0ABZ0UW87_9RICK|nr:hypothetical protein [Candidatus Trichorickettsia mobilis]WPY01362.1 DUF2793 domain-containing protein [Candidatus Trichorickettsia mobilis]
MKTHHYNIDLMTPMQTDKEILFNEALLKIDSFCNSTVRNFIQQLPEAMIVGDKYILAFGENEGDICYCADLAKGWQLLKAKAGMIVFVCEENSFFIFGYDHRWSKVTTAAQAAREHEVIADNNFIGIADQFTLPAATKYISLYLNGNCTILLDQVQIHKFTIILKQNYTTSYRITWSQNILWPQHHPHQITVQTNAMDIISFYRIVETQSFAAVVVGQGYSW